MNAVGIEADGIVGHSVGELGCSYMDGCFTAEQMVLAAYFRGRASIETELIDGLMAAVGLGAKEMKKLCPPDIEVACHNGPAFCTLSGPTESMKTFVKSLQQRGVFAKEVNCANIAYHSKYIAGAGPALLKYLKQVIPNPKPRSPLWVSSSVPESEWDTPLAKLSSAEYHTNNLLGSVLFEDACKHIPNNAITIEIAPHGLLQAILKRSLDKNIINIAVTQRGHPNGTEVLFSALGRLYELGLQPQLTRLYPQIEYPVSRGTPMLSPLVQWEHSEDFFVMIYKQAKGKASERHLTVSWEDKSKQFLSGSVIDGRNVFPAMGFIEIVWETFALVTDQVYTDFPVVFENVRFHRPVDIPKQGDLELGVMVQKGSGRFEVTHSGSLVVSGVVLTSDKISQQLAVLQPLNQDGSELSSQDVYRELSLRGYNYESQFQSIASLHARGQSGKVHWKNNWTTFLDSLLQIHFLQDNRRNLRVPLSIQRLTIDAKQQTSPDYKKMDEVVEVSMYSELGIIRAGLVEVRGLKSVWINRHPPTGQIVLEERVFVPYEEYASLDYWTASRACLHIVLENQQGSVVKVVELNQNGLKPISPQVELLLRDVPNTEASLSCLLLLMSQDCNDNDKQK
ncbi:fatty acid synthase-like [Periplaneta americana]|uniref:fatty acid synthase-like n=1 Tax=Periplaneta americana TaxID=6978 RepID=UPI0037E7EEFC